MTQDSDLWDKRYGKKMSDEEKRVIKDNLISFFEVLREWKAREVGNAQFQ